jgi:RHS repeat-associated protein
LSDFNSTGEQMKFSVTNFFASLLLLAASVMPALGQVDVAAGTSDSATSNIHFSIPVYSKPGFNFTLEVNSHLVMAKPGSSGNWVWQGSTTVTPSTGIEVSMASQWTKLQPAKCNGNFQYEYNNSSIVMPDGSSHPLPSTFTWLAGVGNACYSAPSPLTAVTTDGSNITVVAPATSTAQWFAYDKHGTSFVIGNAPTYGASVTNLKMTDTYGNSISGPLVQGVNSTATYPYVDSTTTGTPSGGVQGQVLSVTENSTPGEVYTYLDGSGATQTVTVVYENWFTPGSNFGCTGVAEIQSFPRSNYLPTAILFSSGQSYTFQYELVRGYGYTGRLSAVVLPLGGSVNYSYNGTNGNGGNGGIDCINAVAPTMTVQASGGTLPQGTIYTINNSGFNSNHDLNITITNNLDNGNIVQMYAAASNPNISQVYGGPWPFTGMFLLSSKVFQGTTQLSATTNCYNGANCGSLTLPPVPSVPITRVDSYSSLGSSGVNHASTLYDSNGNLVQVQLFDIGAGSVPTRTVQYYYGKSYTSNNNCTGYAGGSYIIDTPCEIAVFDHSGTMVSNSQYSHGPKGAITLQGSQLVGGSGAWLSTTYSYNTNGSVHQMTLPNGEVITEGYDGSCNGLLPTSETNSVNGLSTYTVYDSGCFGARVIKFTGVDGNFSKKAYNDPFWRTTQTTDQALNSTNIAYETTTFPHTYVTTAFNGTTLQRITRVNGLGQVMYRQTAQVYGNGSFDTVSNTFDTSNRLIGVYGPCTANIDTECTGAHSSFTYDAMQRLLTSQDANGGVVNNTYLGLDTISTLGPAPAGEHVKTKQFETNGLGQVTSVCDIISSGGAACGQANGGNGYVTKFSYDALGRVLQSSQTFGPVTQNRNYSYDALGRILTTQTPEEGTTSFVYDSFTTPPSGCANFPGSLVQTVNPDGTYTCLNYDGLGRLVLKTYGGNANTDLSAYSYDTGTNGGGRLSSAWTCQGGSGIFSCPLASAKTIETFAYDVRGETTNYTQWPWAGNGTGSISEYYDSLGRLQSVNATGGGAYWNITGYDGEGRATTIAGQNGSVVLQTGAVWGPFGPTQVTFGNGFTQNIGYDNLGNMLSKSTFNGSSCSYAGSGASCLTDTMTWNTNGTLKALERHTNFDKPLIPSDVLVNYLYDDTGRLLTAKGVDSLNNNNILIDQGFSYDRWGNMVNVSNSTNNGSPVPNMYSAGVNSTTNHLSGGGVAYDANGRMTTDEHLNVFTWNVEGKMVARSGQTTPYTQDAFSRPIVVPNDWYLYTPKFAILHGGFYGTWPLPLAGGNSAWWANACSCSHPYAAFIHNGYRGDPAGQTNYGTQTPPYTAQQSMLHSPFGFEVNSINSGGSAALSAFDGLQNQQDSLGNGSWFTDARSVDSVQGRWLSPDPAHSSFTNLYAYTDNDPVNMVDPTGLDDCPAEICTGVSTGGTDLGISTNELGLGNFFDTFGVDATASLSPDGSDFKSTMGLPGAEGLSVPGGVTSGSQDVSSEAAYVANFDSGLTSDFHIGGKPIGGYDGGLVIAASNILSTGSAAANSVGAASEWMGNHPAMTFGVGLAASLYAGDSRTVEEALEQNTPNWVRDLSKPSFINQYFGFVDKAFENNPGKIEPLFEGIGSHGNGPENFYYFDSMPFRDTGAIRHWASQSPQFGTGNPPLVGAPLSAIEGWLGTVGLGPGKPMIGANSLEQ